MATHRGSRTAGRSVINLISIAAQKREAERTRVLRARKRRRAIAKRKALPRWWVVTARSGAKALFEGSDREMATAGITGEGPFVYAQARQLAWGGAR